MDQQFDEDLIDIKPYLLNLPYKTERQRCAIWIKKLCEPALTSQERKNRNLYSKLLLHMLKRGIVDGPFAKRPDSGSLPSLPSYMTIFFDEPSPNNHLRKEGSNIDTTSNFITTPEWAKEELPLNLSDVFPAANVGDSSTENYNVTTSRTANLNHSKDSKTHNENISNIYSFQKKKSPRKGSSFREEQSLLLIHDKELRMKAKIQEAEFHEEKLNLQHKHDLALQKVLNRKNAEIDELKRHYKEKDKDYEDIKQRLDRKVQTLSREGQVERENKEREVDELNKLLEENAESIRLEYDEKIHAVMVEVEKEKYELQKTHTKSIQDLLDDTNSRLEAMEEEYNNQTQTTKLMIVGMENHVSQLTNEVATTSEAKQLLFVEKHELEKENKQLVIKVEDITDRHNQIFRELSDARDELSGKRKLCSKHALDIESIKEEQKHKTTRVKDAMRDLEDQVCLLKRSLQETEEQKSRAIKEQQSVHHQDVMRLQHLHENFVHSLRREWEQEKASHYRSMKELEEVVQDKDKQISQLTVTQKQCAVEAEQAIESYKTQASDAQQKVYADMRNQLVKMDEDLQLSTRAKHMLQEEFDKQIKFLNDRHADELKELRMRLDCDRETIAQKFTSDRDKLLKDCEQRVTFTEAKFRDALTQQQNVNEEKKSQHQDVVSSLEEQVRTLQEEIHSANSVRRQQLVELGLLREEERQKATRDHDMVVAKLEADMDKQRMELHNRHAAELEQQMHMMKTNIEKLEVEYREQIERTQERMMDAMEKEASLMEEIGRSKEAEEAMQSGVATVKNENESLKLKNNSLALSFRAKLEKMREEGRNKERELNKLEFDFRNEVSRVKLECEERLKGMMPKSLKLDLEETIDSLRSQVKSLQQRCEILQDDADYNLSKSLHSSSVRL